LLLERAMRPVFRELFALDAPDGTRMLGIRTRLLVSWALGAAIPLLIIALSYVGRGSADSPNQVAIWALVTVGIAVGALVITTAARSITEPLDAIRAALARVQRDELDVDVPVDDGGEVGQLQAGFNRMVAGLRDRRALADLFGRHVGTEVASLARAQGVHLGGERREASVVFVDLVGSSRLAQSRSADAVVGLLNTFFATVVERIEQEGGWVNKFEGDAALCVFGAPVELDDPATAALCTARAVRDQVAEMGELQIGIGVAAGPVIAGQIGAASRLEYTIIGDAVNEAARLTDLAKRVEGNILASDATVEAATPEEQAHWIAGRITRLRGREAPTHTYRTVASEGEAAGGTVSLARRLTDVAKAVAELPQQSGHHRD
jgi:adenylate cyclase